jgi:hypothetical protein
MLRRVKCGSDKGKSMRSLLSAAAVFNVVCMVQSGLAVTMQNETVASMSPRNQAAWWSPIVSRSEAEYVSYLSANSPQDDIFVARRAADGPWEIRDTGVNATYDVGHTQTSMAIDGQGYIHVAYGMHNNPMRLVTSNAPESISAGFSTPASSAIAAFASGSYTYPNMTTVPSGDVYMIVRDQRSSYSNQQGRLFRFDSTTRSWSELPPFAGQSGTTVYPDQILSDASGDLHILWEWASGGAQAARHYGSYARFDPDTNTYYRANGTPYAAGPITIASADIYQSLEGSETFTANLHGVQSAKLALDDQGRPMIAYAYSTNGTDSGYQHRFARWTGSEWMRSTMMAGPFDTDKPWIAYSPGILRYYGTVSPTDPLYTSTDDIFVRTSTNLGATWSTPIAITSGLDIQRPVGFSVGATDHLYLPSITSGDLHVARVNWNGPLPQPQPAFTYFNPFTTGSLAQATSAYSLEAASGALRYSAAGGTNAIVDTATQQVTNIGAADFILSTRFVLNNVAGTGNSLTIGFGAFGTSNNFSSTNGQSFYLADWVVDTNTSQGQLRILSLGDTAGFLNAMGDSDGINSNGSSVSVGTEYELRLVGKYTGASLGLTLTLFDTAGNPIGTSATASDSSPLAGTYFGYRNRLAGTNHAINVSYDQFSLSAPAELLGDYNQDGTVDAADYVIWRKHKGQHVANNTSADGNGNGVIDTADYRVWASNFGNTIGTASRMSTDSPAVPEPTSWIILIALGYMSPRHGRQPR